MSAFDEAAERAAFEARLGCFTSISLEWDGWIARARVAHEREDALRAERDALKDELFSVFDEVACVGSLNDSTPNAAGTPVPLEPKLHEIVATAVKNLKAEHDAAIEETRRCVQQVYRDAEQVKALIQERDAAIARAEQAEADCRVLAKEARRARYVDGLAAYLDSRTPAVREAMGRWE